MCGDFTHTFHQINSKRKNQTQNTNKQIDKP